MQIKITHDELGVHEIVARTEEGRNLLGVSFPRTVYGTKCGLRFKTSVLQHGDWECNICKSRLSN